MRESQQFLITVQDYYDAFRWFGFQRAKIQVRSSQVIVVRVPIVSNALKRYIEIRKAAQVQVRYEKLNFWECRFVAFQTRTCK